MNTMGVVCGQCNTSHPPLAEGAICPVKAGQENMEKAGSQETEDGTKVDYTDILPILTTILTSQISIKKIKDIPKLKSHLIVEMTKALENYNE